MARTGSTTLTLMLLAVARWRGVGPNTKFCDYASALAAARREAKVGLVDDARPADQLSRHVPASPAG
jgi:hypothetical protein